MDNHPQYLHSLQVSGLLQSLFGVDKAQADDIYSQGPYKEIALDELTSRLHIISQVLGQTHGFRLISQFPFILKVNLEDLPARLQDLLGADCPLDSAQAIMSTCPEIFTQHSGVCFDSYLLALAEMIPDPDLRWRFAVAKPRIFIVQLTNLIGLKVADGFDGDFEKLWLKVLRNGTGRAPYIQSYDRISQSRIHDAIKLRLRDKIQDERLRERLCILLARIFNQRAVSALDDFIAHGWPYEDIRRLASSYNSILQYDKSWPEHYDRVFRVEEIMTEAGLSSTNTRTVIKDNPWLAAADTEVQSRLRDNFSFIFSITDDQDDILRVLRGRPFLLKAGIDIVKKSLTRYPPGYNRPAENTIRHPQKKRQLIEPPIPLQTRLIADELIEPEVAQPEPLAEPEPPPEAEVEVPPEEAVVSADQAAQEETVDVEPVSPASDIADAEPPAVVAIFQETTTQSAIHRLLVALDPRYTDQRWKKYLVTRRWFGIHRDPESPTLAMLLKLVNAPDGAKATDSRNLLIAGIFLGRDLVRAKNNALSKRRVGLMSEKNLDAAILQAVHSAVSKPAKPSGKRLRRLLALTPDVLAFRFHILANYIRRTAWVEPRYATYAWERLMPERLPPQFWRVTDIPPPGLKNLENFRDQLFEIQTRLESLRTRGVQKWWEPGYVRLLALKSPHDFRATLGSAPVYQPKVAKVTVEDAHWLLNRSTRPKNDGSIS